MGEGRKKKGEKKKREREREKESEIVRNIHQIRNGKANGTIQE